MKLITLIISLFCLSHALKAQDAFVGTWEIIPTEEKQLIDVKAVLKIGDPERNLLYPAALTLSCDSFQANYQVLLVKRNSRQLAIGKVKFPIAESPFNLGEITALLNGNLDFSKDLKGNFLLTVNRLPSKKTGIIIPSSKEISADHAETVDKLLAFFQSEDIVLKKINNENWNEENARKILAPKLSFTYFGIVDTIFVGRKTGTLRCNANKDIDIISVAINGNTILDQVDSKKKRDEEDFLIDTGLNIICLFADDFGKNAPSTASIDLLFDNLERKLDFSAKENFAAGFIVQKVYLKYNESDNTKFKEYSGGDINNNIINQTANSDDGSGSTASNGLKRKNKVIGNIVSNSAQLTFAIWDDAIEDGDTISLSVNGKWIAKGFPVKKRAKFITVTLDPGPNIITFVAENLGSIIPNTSVLEIIDGKKESHFI
jgi:hypothetical protein